MLTNYKTFHDGQDMWIVLGVDEGGKPTGTALGTYTGAEAADKAIEEMRNQPIVVDYAAIASPFRTGFKVFDNGRKWIALYSNALKDNSGEIFPRAETDNFIARVESGIIPYPELWHFHIPGTKHGQAQWLGRIGLITVAVGSFDDSPLAQKFIQHYRDNKQHLSHGFFFDARGRKGGIYGRYDTFEITTLPPGWADNPYTDFLVRDSKMALTEAQIKSLLTIAGDELTSNIIGGTKQLSDTLQQMNVAFKAKVDAAEGNQPPEKQKEPDGDEASKSAARLSTIEATLVNGFKSVVADMQNAVNQLQQQIVSVNNNVKTIAQVVANEHAMQPPATQAPTTQVPQSDPAMAYIQQMAKQQQAVQQQFQQGAPLQNVQNTPNMPYGVFGEVLAGMGAKNLNPSGGFEVPGVQPMPQQPQIQLPQQQFPQSPLPQMPPQQQYQQPQFQQPPQIVFQNQPPQLQPQQQMPQPPIQQMPNQIIDQFGIPQAPPTGLGGGVPRLFIPNANGV